VIALAAASNTSHAQPPSDAPATAQRRVIDTVRGFDRYDVSGIGNLAALDPNDPDKIVSATVLLGGESVVAQRSRASRTRTRFDARVAERQVVALQDALIPKLQQSGAAVTGRMTQVVNAVRVRTRAGDLAALAATPGVLRVQVSKVYTLANGNADTYTQATQAWQDLGVTGKGLRIAIIDDGVDYTHADFGGSGDPADYAANDRTVVESGTFPTAKVVGGTDFVGDDYDADADQPGESDVPVPDPDPLSCGGHGTHVAGTAAGSGVLSDGTTFAGPYNASTIDDHQFSVAPGSAPEASILAYKVFGCDGSVEESIIVDAIDQAVADGAAVINMSLGSTFGTADGIEAAAIDAATEAGVLVVASAGNEGPNAYMTGAPASSDRALSVAANDVSFPTLVPVEVTGDITATAGNSNLHEFAGASVIGELVDVGLGCEAADYAAAAGKIALSTRGVCARVDRAILGDAAGAVAVLMINNAGGLPPVEGAIDGVDIPFVGIDGTQGAAFRAVAASPGNSITLSGGAPVPNPGFTSLASFTSAGPRNGDSGIKPDIAAPGVSVLSAEVGSGTEAIRNSGTSMASPHAAGIAVLVRQANPSWTAMQVKAALQSTADPSMITGYETRRAGTGAINARRAVDTVAFVSTSTGRNSVSFGFRQISWGMSANRSFRITNTGTKAITYDLAAEFNGESLGADITFYPRTVKVPAGSSRSVTVNLRFTTAEAAALLGAGDVPAGRTLSVYGLIVATPRVGGPGVYPLRTAFNVVPNGTSDVRAWRPHPDAGIGELKVVNYGTHAGAADQYQWVITDPAKDASDPTFPDVIDVGVQSFPVAGGDSFMVFAVNTAKPRSTHAVDFLELPINTDADPEAEFRIWVVDEGLVFAGVPSGVLVALGLDEGFNLINAWEALAPMNGSTVLFPMLASDFGLTPAAGTFSFSVESSSIVADGVPDITGTGTFNPFTPAVSVGAFETLPPFSDWTDIPGAVDPAQAELQKPLGWLIITLDDAGGPREGERVKLTR
jgi:subtilisin family serine protease